MRIYINKRGRGRGRGGGGGGVRMRFNRKESILRTHRISRKSTDVFKYKAQI